MRTPLIAILCCLVIPVAARAESANDRLLDALDQRYPQAEANQNLVSAYHPPDLSKFRCYAVVLKAGIPAARARYYIAWEDYDYWPSVLRGDNITTRTGKPWTHLQPGDIVAIVDQAGFDNTLYLKLMTPEVYVPEQHKHVKHQSRVTAMFGIQFPKQVIRDQDAQTVFDAFGQWLAPFPTLEAAKAWVAELRAKGQLTPVIPPPAELAPAIGPTKAEQRAAKKEQLKQAQEEYRQLQQQTKDAQRRLQELQLEDPKNRATSPSIPR